MSKSVRGTMSGMAVFFGSLGSAGFTLAAGYMFDSIGPSAPFMLVAGADAVIFVFTLIFLGCGMISKSD